MQRVGQRVGMLVQRQPLANHLDHGVLPLLGDLGAAVGGQKAVDAAGAQAVGERVPASQPAAFVVGLRIERRRNHHQARRSQGSIEREPQESVGSHRGPHEHGPLDPAVVEHGLEVGREVVVSVCVGLGAGEDCPWPRAS